MDIKNHYEYTNGKTYNASRTTFFKPSSSQDSNNRKRCLIQQRMDKNFTKSDRWSWSLYFYIYMDSWKMETSQ